MINIQNVSFGYTKNNEVLKNINFKIKPGECILFCGRSGCGKTTITKLINGLIPHFTTDCQLQGEITLDELCVKNTNVYELAERVGSVFQNPKSQFFNLNSDAELAFGLENSGVLPDNINKRIDITTEALKIKKLRNRNIFSMSGGEKQSLAFASIYAMNPDIYVLDEPTANLDQNAIDVLREQIIKIKAEGKTILIAEHRIYFLADIIDRAVFVENGEIIRIFSREEFLNISDETRRKMGLRTLCRNSFIELKNMSKIVNGDELVIKNLSCQIKKTHIFENLSFSVKKGEILGIIGNNGAGKTTLLRCIAGLIKQSKGQILFEGRPLKNKEQNRLCYLIMQDVNHQLFSDSVWNECELSLSDINESNIEGVLNDFDLLNLKDNHPMALSGGQKQRLAIATSILHDKKIILFDEPTSGLDYEHMLAVSSRIKKLRDDGHIIIIVTHDNEFIECTCNRILRL